MPSTERPSSPRGLPQITRTKCGAGIQTSATTVGALVKMKLAWAAVILRFGRWLLLLGIVFASVVTTASAVSALFSIQQIYSNADGTVQFVVIYDRGQVDCDSGEAIWAGQTLFSTGAGVDKTFVFPNNLSTCATSGRRILIATQGFAALGIVSPDYVIPNGFLPRPNGELYFAGVSFVKYTALPNDGVTSILADGTHTQNVATNLAGASASVTPNSIPSTVNINQHGLTGSWYEPAKSGQGVEVEVFADLIAPGTGQVQVSWFTFDTTAPGGPERQRWYTMGGNVATGAASVNLPIYQNVGGNFNAGPITTATQVGTVTLRFADCEHGTLDYTFTDGSGRSGTLDLSRLTKNVTCVSSGARPVNRDFAFCGNWYDPATSGQGITLEINPLSPVAFFAWYTYAPSGAAAGAAGQRWYTGQSGYMAGARTLAMKLYATTGGLFDESAPAPATIEVGTATLTFQTCTAATLDYTFTGGSSAGAAGSITLSKIGPAGPGCVM